MVGMVPSEEFAIVSARISPETQDKLERYLHYLNEREPGLNVKTSTAVRMLIVRGLEQVEKEVGTLPPLPRGKR